MPINAYTPPVPPTAVAFDTTTYTTRASYTYARRAYMEGGWEPQLQGVMCAMLTPEAVESMRCLDTSHNIFRDTISRLSTRYDDPVSVPDGEVGDLDLQDLFSDHPTVERYALAYNVAVVSLRTVDKEQVVEVLPPDHCDVRWTDQGDIGALRLARPIPGASVAGLPRYVLEEWDLEAGTHSVFSGGKWVVSKNYPWTYRDGKKFIPVTLVRASKPTDWWGACRWPELIEATLEEGVAWTIHRYGRLNSANGLPYVLDAALASQRSEGEDSGQKQVNASHQMVLQLSSESNKQGEVGVLQPTFDAEKDVEAIAAAYTSRMECLGIGDSSLQRGGAESGYAIVVRREGLLRLRRSTETQFRKADQEFLRKAVACQRIFGGGPVESDSYRVEYAPVPSGSAEAGESRSQEKHDLDIGIASPASILAKREGISLEDARVRLEAIKQVEVAKVLKEPAAVVVSTPSLESQPVPTPSPDGNPGGNVA